MRSLTPVHPLPYRSTPTHTPARHVLLVHLAHGA